MNERKRGSLSLSFSRVKPTVSLLLFLLFSKRECSYTHILFEQRKKNIFDIEIVKKKRRTEKREENEKSSTLLFFFLFPSRVFPSLIYSFFGCSYRGWRDPLR